MRHSLQRGGAVYSSFLLLVAGGIIVSGVVAFMRFSHTNPLSPSFLEKSPPSISLKEAPLGIGADEVPLKVEVSDPDAGLDEVIVRISQRNQPKELLRKRYDNGSSRGEVFTIPLKGKELGLREGNAELQVLAFDRSLWSNGSVISKSLPVNFIAAKRGARRLGARVLQGSRQDTEDPRGALKGGLLSRLSRQGVGPDL